MAGKHSVKIKVAEVKLPEMNRSLRDLRGVVHPQNNITYFTVMKPNEALNTWRLFCFFVVLLNR